MSSVASPARPAPMLNAARGPIADQKTPNNRLAGNAA